MAVRGEGFCIILCLNIITVINTWYRVVVGRYIVVGRFLVPLPPPDCVSASFKQPIIIRSHPPIFN